MYKSCLDFDLLYYWITNLAFMVGVFTSNGINKNLNWLLY